MKKSSVAGNAARVAAATIERSAPGRVNLIGEHTDYTGGLVLPMAIHFKSDVSVSPRDDQNYSFTSEQYPRKQRVMSKADRPAKAKKPGWVKGEWSNYCVGVLCELQKLGIKPKPFKLHLRGNVPLGAGLSSSASVEVSTAMALLAFAGKTLPPEKIALLCQAAEHNYAGSPCGIMDQFVSVHAKAGHALLLDTFSKKYELLPMNRGKLADCRVVVVNSTVKHEIGGGEYARRRREAEKGQAAIKAKFGARDLGVATLKQLEAVKPDISYTAYKRAHHVISENDRVRKAKKAMFAGDPELLGRLMVASHASLRDDFEVSVWEIDFLVSQALALKGCYGARITGGGFGGCTVNLVAKEHVAAFETAIKASYKKWFNIDAPVYVFEAMDGAVELSKK
ncbi:MAG: galactokinase [Acidobacteriaceae bacterium]|nr:galactokinase [Acidobacteriaceae bacterium]